MGKPQQNENEHKKSFFSEMEEEIVQLWDEIDAFKTSVDMRPADKQYVFYDGPPFATGLPHYGHMLASTVKDSVPRFWTMRGYRVERVWGWDCHGLPIENLIEKELGLNSRKDIEEYGIDKFNEACRAAILKYDEEWKKFVKRIGRWIDMDNSYKTMDNSYMESEWWAFKTMFDKNLIYEGRRVSLYCPRCETPLSNFEIAMDNSYQDVEDNSVIWKFPVVGQEDVSLLAWTTTPWSTPGTTGLAVGPDFDYAKVKVGDAYVVAAKERLAFAMQHLEEGEWEIVEEMKGAELVGWEYEPIVASYKELPETKEHADTVYRVYAGDHVEVTEGTGLVTINGTYGEVDMEAAQANGLPLLFDVAENGTFNELMPGYEGVNIKEAEEQLLTEMAQAGRVWRSEPYTHSYPHCWRCETPLYYYAGPAWFVNIQEIKGEMVEQNKEINWHPEHLKEGRFGQGLQTAPDWNISRSRFWGTAMPVWKCADDHVTVVGSVEELGEKSGQDVSTLDLHRPHIDAITVTCDECSGEAKRIEHVLDTWVDSGSMPFASLHYPFENKERFESFYPADFISEYIAQTRGWFYTLHVLSTALFGKPTFRNSVTTGTVLAEDGSKMSKSKKNYPAPDLMFEKYSVDAVRFYLLSTPLMDGENLNFAEKDVDEIQKKFMNTFWNVYKFYAMFAEKEEGQITEVTDPSEVTNVLDRWVLAQVHGFVAEVTEAYESYNIRRTAAPLQDIVQEISTWYLRRSRDRFKGDDADDRVMALRVLYTAIRAVILAAAPVTPFISEQIFQRIRRNDEAHSVHHLDWPEANDAFVNQEVLDTMQRVREVIETSLALRAEAGVKVRQPLQSVTVVGEELEAGYVSVIAEELNVKEVQFGTEASIDTDITEELRIEGALRELVRQTNFMRKKAGLSIGDRVQVTVQTDSADVHAALEQHRDEYLSSVLGDAVTVSQDEQERPVKVNGEQVTISFS